jgi:hypothetical protein
LASLIPVAMLPHAQSSYTCRYPKIQAPIAQILRYEPIEVADNLSHAFVMARNHAARAPLSPPAAAIGSHRHCKPVSADEIAAMRDFDSRFDRNWVIFRPRQRTLPPGPLPLRPKSRRQVPMTNWSRWANNGHRKLLHLRLRGAEFNDGDQSNQNEDGQHSGLRDREGWFGLYRSQRIESRQARPICT